MKSFYEMLQILKNTNENYEDNYEDDGNDGEGNDVDPSDYDDGLSKAERRAAEYDIDQAFRDKKEKERWESERKKRDKKYTDDEGVAPNGERYNSILYLYAVDESTAQNDYRYGIIKDDHGKGYTFVVYAERLKSDRPEFPVMYKLYQRANHKYGVWKPFDGENLKIDDLRDKYPEVKDAQ